MEMTTDKREHIMNTAELLFGMHGFEGTPIRELCKMADVNVAMVNYYFGNKAGLFEALVKRKVSFLKGKLQELSEDKSLTPLEKMDLVVEGYVKRFFEQRSFNLTLMREITMQQRDQMHGQIAETLIANTRFIKKILQDGIRKKAFRKVDVEMTIATLIGTINQVLISEDMCRLLCDEDAAFKPYQDPKFQQRTIDHLKKLMHAHLLP